MHFPPMKHHQFYENLPRPARYNLSDACGATATLSDLVNADELEILQKVPLVYGTVPGREDLRQEIIGLYDDLYPQLTADHVTVLSGTEEGLFSIMAALLEPGDEVIGMLPCYPSLSDLPALFGASFKAVQLSPDTQWQPSIAQFAELITPTTKAVIINSPHNPTGMVLSQNWIDELIGLCDKHGLYLISDEVFAFTDFEQVGCKVNVLAYERAVLTNVLSKSFGLPGVRIGWVMTQDTELTQSIRNLKTYNSICQSQLDEQLACFVLQKADEIIQRNNQIIRSNLQIFDLFLASSIGLGWHRPKAGIVGLVHSETEVEPILNGWFENDVLALPGNLFGIQGNYFRVGFGKADFPEAVVRISG